MNNNKSEFNHYTFTLEVTIKDIFNFFDNKVEGYDTELFYFCLEHILKHIILIYNDDISLIEKCDLNLKNEVFVFLVNINHHLMRLGLLCDLADNLFMGFPDFTKADNLKLNTFKKEPILCGYTGNMKTEDINIPRIFLTKFGHTNIKGLNDGDEALIHILDAIQRIYIDLLPFVSMSEKLNDTEKDYIILEIGRHFIHIADHTKNDFDFFGELFDIFEPR
ncbi:MAG: hypothetical protein FK732_09645 [Asgard group archaeon]|nr:hypothetical protein [Asgard group archaeon]